MSAIRCAKRIVDNPRPAKRRAQFRRIGNRLAHSGDSARLDQLGEQFQLADAFHVRDLGRNSAGDQRVEPGDEDFGHRAPHHRRFVEQIGVAFLGETSRR